MVVLTLAVRPGERPESFRGCLWPPAQCVGYRGVMLALGGRSCLRAIRRDAQWCDREPESFRAAPQIESSLSHVQEPPRALLPMK